MSADLTAAMRDLVRQVVREVLAEERTAIATGTELLTAEEAAAIAKLKPATIRAWATSGRLRHTRVGRLLRIARADLDAALKLGVRDPQPSPEERARRAVDRLLGGGS